MEPGVLSPVHGQAGKRQRRRGLTAESERGRALIAAVITTARDRSGPVPVPGPRQGRQLVTRSESVPVGSPAEAGGRHDVWQVGLDSPY